MTRRALRLAFIVAVLAIAAGYFVVSKRPPKSEPHVATSGNYSDDWMKICGPVQGSAQKSCTAKLDAAYGLVDGAPVPTDTQGGASSAGSKPGKE
jgi:hypothetical protein